MQHTRGAWFAHAPSGHLTAHAVRPRTLACASARLRAAALAAVVAGACLSLAACTTPALAPVPVTIDDTAVYPESVTSTRAGDLIVGSIKGNLYRARRGDSKAVVWVRPDAENALQSVFGVLAHEPSATLWVCSVPNPFAPPVGDRVAELVALDLASGRVKSRYPFPPPRSVCNDMTVARDGAVYAADTQNGRILRLAPGAATLAVYGEDPLLAGIDGIAFAGDGRLYVNNVRTGALLRVEVGGERMGRVTALQLSEPLGGPDGMRLVSGNRFVLAEGTTGRIDEITIEGDRALVRVLKTGLNSSPGVTPVGKLAWAIEGKIGYLIDPKLRGRDPGPFTIIPVPLP
jgi:sugar lactone lactonase YvrE